MKNSGEKSKFLRGDEKYFFCLYFSPEDNLLFLQRFALWFERKRETIPLKTSEGGGGGGFSDWGPCQQQSLPNTTHIVLRSRQRAKPLARVARSSATGREGGWFRALNAKRSKIGLPKDISPSSKKTKYTHCMFNFC